MRYVYMYLFIFLFVREIIGFCFFEINDSGVLKMVLNFIF